MFCRGLSLFPCAPSPLMERRRLSQGDGLDARWRCSSIFLFISKHENEKLQITILSEHNLRRQMEVRRERKVSWLISRRLSHAHNWSRGGGRTLRYDEAGGGSGGLANFSSFVGQQRVRVRGLGRDQEHN